jgi:hypothetical protein
VKQKHRRPLLLVASPLVLASTLRGSGSVDGERVLLARQRRGGSDCARGGVRRRSGRVHRRQRLRGLGRDHVHDRGVLRRHDRADVSSALTDLLHGGGHLAPAHDSASGLEMLHRDAGRLTVVAGGLDGVHLAGERRDDLRGVHLRRKE